MKMLPAHYAQLKTLVQETLTARNETIASRAEHYAAEGLTGQTRFVFDLLWIIPRDARQAWFDECRIYDYLNDAHIDTALRAIASELA